MPTPDVVSRFRDARQDPALAVLEGFHAVKHAIRFGAAFELVVTRNPPALRALADRLAPDVAARLTAIAVEVPAGRFGELSPTPPDTGVIAIARRRPAALADLLADPADAPLVLLESPSHSGNIGAVIRVAAAAGAAGVVTTGSIDPWNPGAVRGSAGLHFALPVVRVDAFVPGTRDVYAIDPEGDEVIRGALPAGVILAFGSERSGLSSGMRRAAVRRLRIPMQSGVSSLNLATAVAAVLYLGRFGR